MAKYKYILEPYKGPRTRHTCPNCNRKELTRYINTETGKHLASYVGKCNRENKCKYHYTPKQYFRNNPQEQGKDSELWKTTYKPPKPIQYLPREVMEKSLQRYEQNNFIKFLVKLFGREKAFNLARTYKLGTSKQWENDNGLSVVFWQVDREENIRQAKVMAYHPETGRRLKNGVKVMFMGKKILKDNDTNLKQCFFGEHLINQDEGKPVALVESEKTAVIMAGFMPKVIWIATGGKHGAKWTDKEVYQALEGRQVILYPDLGAFDEWKEKAKILITVCHYQVNDRLERAAIGNDIQEGYDIADYLIKAHFLAIEEPKAREEPVQAQEKPLEQPQEEENLPPGMEAVKIKDREILEVNGLPFTWLNDNEQAEALKRMMKENPNLNKLIERFGLELEGVKKFKGEGT